MFVPGRGLEPPRDYSQQLLRLHCLPFQHPGNLWPYLTILFIKKQDPNKNTFFIGKVFSNFFNFLLVLQLF